MQYKLIACEVFFREVCLAAALTQHTVDIEFTPKDAHDESAVLRKLIQDGIERTEASDVSYDAVLLGYGLCGNSTAGLYARSLPIVIPRAHDCCTLFLGSKQEFREHFSENPSRPFSSTGYMERGESSRREASMESVLGLDKTFDEYAAMYGEDNARYIIQTLHPEIQWSDDNHVVFIEIPETAHLGFAARCRKDAEAEGRGFRLLEGNMRLIHGLVSGDWNSEDFLVVSPGQEIVPRYDWEEIVASETLDRG